MPRPKTTTYVVTGIMIIVVTFFGLGGWAALAPLDGAVIGAGVVTVDSNRKTVQHAEGGIVKKILVRDGDIVERGQLLVRLDDTQARANLRIIQSQLRDLHAREARLSAERDGLDRLGTPTSLSGPLVDAETLEVMAGQEELFNARRIALQGQIDLLTERQTQSRIEITGLEAQRTSKVRQIALIEDELSGLRKLFEKGYTPRTRILDLERTAEQLTGERGSLVADIARARQSINEVELQIIQLQQTYHERAVEELREVQAEIADLDERRVAAAAVLERIDVVAPNAGFVVGMQVHTVGAVIVAGDEILDIVPEDDELMVDAQIQPGDIDKVALGHEVDVRLSAFDLRTTPILKGKVATVSADRLIDPVTNLPYYLARVVLSEMEPGRFGQFKLTPGMPAEVFIKTGEHTALNYLLKPLLDSLARAFVET